MKTKEKHPVIGERFGKLYGLWRTDKVVTNSKGRPIRYYLLRCDCGNYKEAAYKSLVCGHTRSCGCLNLEVANGREIHGQSRRGNWTPEYGVWTSMNRRCNPNNKYSRLDYAVRGITVCEEWSAPGGFVRFFKHMGPRPSDEHSLDRIDNDKGYFPGNVRWATLSMQNKNRRKKVCLGNYSNEEFESEAKLRGFYLCQIQQAQTD